MAVEDKYDATELKGFVDHIVYRNSDNGYTVLILSGEDGDETLVGVFPQIEEGQMIRVEGEYIEHISYGVQFSVKKFEVCEPEDVVSIERYLSSGAIKGIGAALAKRIVKKFGEDTFRIMEEEPERLIEIKGISERIARQIAEQVEEKKDMREAMIYLQQLGISLNLSAKIYARYDQQLFQVLSSNPYQLVEDIQGVGFRTADEIAKRAGILPDSVFRIKSGIVYLLTESANDGHLYLPRLILTAKAMELLGVDEGIIETEIDNLIAEKKLVRKEEMGEERIFAALHYYMELDCARMLQDMNLSSMEEPSRILKALERIEEKSEINLDEKQRDAVLMAASNGVSVITGGPGTGKTTIIKMLLEYFEGEGLDLMLAAPTGRAAKRMTEATGYEARTIHRMLEIGAEGTMVFQRNDENPLEADVIIVDEMSMVDIFLFHALLKAITIGTRLIMVGDVDQLPSVGPGSVLRDVISSGRYPVARLDRIFRQASVSDIVVNAHKINRGDDIVLDNKSKDFFFLERNQAEVIIQGIIYLVTSKLPPYVEAKPFDIQVMTPMRKGPLGVEILNKRLQEALNPPGNRKEEVFYQDTLFREGDKVMQIKNNYQLEWEIRSKYGILIDHGQGVFNGDMGIVKSINRDAGTLVVVYDDVRCVTYTAATLEELELAYAITIHKSQGSEYPAVVIPVLTGPPMLMSRNLLYTAVTRARKCVMLLGSSKTVSSMIANKNEQVRYTSLKERIIEMEELY